MRSVLFCLLFSAQTTAVLAQGSYTVSVLKEAAPAATAAAIRELISDSGFRIQDEKGQTLADIWLRKSIPASEKPSGPKAAVLFPFLADGELIGVLQFTAEGHDYRDQAIAKGVYTLRYGLQPVNGDHLGVSVYRDYALLLPAAKDQTPALPARKQLEAKSAESAGTSHPAVLLLQGAPGEAAKTLFPSMIRDAEKNTWSVAVPFNLLVKGQQEAIVQPVLLVVVGAAAV
jgi:hypothetical protein